VGATVGKGGHPSESDWVDRRRQPSARARLRPLFVASLPDGLRTPPDRGSRPPLRSRLGQSSTASSACYRRPPPWRSGGAALRLAAARRRAVRFPSPGPSAPAAG